jgi:AraC-like DNA-binding protein
MEYLEYPVPEDLGKVLRCVWSLAGTTVPLPEASEPVLPDGCPELILNSGRPFAERRHGTYEPQAMRFLYGQLTHALHLRPVVPCSMIGVRLRPHGAYALFGARAVVRDTMLSLDDLDPVFDRAVQEALNREELQSRAMRIIELLRGRIRHEVEGPILELVRAIEQGHDDRSLNEIKAALPMSARQLERRFQAVVGLRPVLFARIVRLRRLVEHLRNGDGSSFTELAHAAGYYDQAHFNRDLKSFTGLSPRAYFGQDLVLPAYFSGVR